MDDDLERTRGLIADAHAGECEAYEELFACHRAVLEPELARRLRGRRPGGTSTGPTSCSDAADGRAGPLTEPIRP